MKHLVAAPLSLVLVALAFGGGCPRRLPPLEPSARQEAQASLRKIQASESEAGTLSVLAMSVVADVEAKRLPSAYIDVLEAAGEANAADRATLLAAAFESAHADVKRDLAQVCPTLDPIEQIQASDLRAHLTRSCPQLCEQALACGQALEGMYLPVAALLLASYQRLAEGGAIDPAERDLLNLALTGAR